MRQCAGIIIVVHQSIKLQPDYSNYHTALGVANIKLSNLNTAKKSLLEALKIDPENGDALRNLGGLFGKQDDYKKALYYLKKAFNVDPHNPQIIYGTAFAYGKMENYKKADDFYNIILDNDFPGKYKQMTKNRLTEIANAVSTEFKTEAMYYLLEALNLFKDKSEHEINEITFEINFVGRNGFDIVSPMEQYSVKSLKGKRSGLEMLCIMYAGFQKIDESEDIGMDLSEEYKLALELFRAEDII